LINVAVPVQVRLCYYPQQFVLMIDDGQGFDALCMQQEMAGWD